MTLVEPGVLGFSQLQGTKHMKLAHMSTPGGCELGPTR